MYCSLQDGYEIGLYLQGITVKERDSFSRKMEATYTSETLVSIYQTTPK